MMITFNSGVSEKTIQQVIHDIQQDDRNATITFDQEKQAIIGFWDYVGELVIETKRQPTHDEMSIRFNGELHTTYNTDDELLLIIDDIFDTKRYFNTQIDFAENYDVDENGFFVEK